MKANEVPEKLYLHPTANGKIGASWLTFPLTDNDIEYIRTDAFIEKTYNWLKNYAFADDNKKVNLPTLLHDFLKDSRNF